jgi:hypothetical protein
MEIASSGCFFSLPKALKSEGAESGLHGVCVCPEMTSQAGRLLPPPGFGKSHRTLTSV